MIARAGIALLAAAAVSLTACGSRDHGGDSAATGGDSSAAGGFGPGHARARLLSETGAVAPGSTFTLGVTLDLEPGWHTYWDGFNDTGYPIRVTPHLPDGFTAGDLEWPAPERLVSPGDILDHVYRDHVTLLLPVQVPADLKPGSEVTLNATVEWLACHEVCVPGSGEATLTLPVGTPGTDAWRRQQAKVPAEARTRFEETRKRLPRPLTPESGVRWHWDSSGGDQGKVLIVESDGADRLEFYPARDSAPPAAIIQDGVSDTGTMTLPLGDNYEHATAVHGVLEVKRDGTTRFYTLEAPIP